jgi:hypothetical protein
MFRPSLVLSLGIVLLAIALLKEKQKQVESEPIIDEISRYLHFSRIQSAVDPEQQALINRITESWSNRSYRWEMPQTNISNP